MAATGFKDQVPRRTAESAGTTPEAVKNVLDAVKGLGFEDKELKLADNGMGTYFFNQKDLYVQVANYGKARLWKIALYSKDAQLSVEGKGPTNVKVSWPLGQLKEMIASGKMKKITREQYLED